MEYPKAMYLKGWEDLEAMVIVAGRDEEQAARKQGYKMLVGPAETVPAQAEPAKRGRKPKAQ